MISNMMTVKGYEGTSSVSNAFVLGLENALVGSSYPMRTDNLKQDITDKMFNVASKLGTTEIGHGHDNFLNGVVVQFDIRFSNKVWVEAERYHFLDFISSQSTMHRITKFDLDAQYNKYVDERMINIMKELVDKYNVSNDTEDYLRVLYSNPAGFMLTAKMTTNFRQLKTIYNQRKDHRLPCWREFCDWLLTVPYFKELCLKDGSCS